MNNPLISIIVPVYNVEPYLPQCIDSVLNQSYANFEIILINDGSTDNSGLICDQYQKGDARIIVIHQANGGLSAARNSGLEIAKGDYIWFIDSDDWIVADAVTFLINEINKNSALEMIAFSMIDYFDDKKTFSEPIYLNSITCTDGNDFIKQNKTFYAPVCSYLYNNEFVKKNNFLFELNIIHEDDYFNLNCFSKVTKICKIPSGLYYYRRRLDSISFSKVTITRIRSFLKLLELCNTLKKSNLSILFIENQIFGYIKTLFVLLNQIKLTYNKKITYLKKVKAVNETISILDSDFFYIKFEKYLYNKNPIYLYIYLNYLKLLKYILQFVHYHILNKLVK